MLNLEDLQITAGFRRITNSFDKIDDKPLDHISFINQSFENIKLANFAIEMIEQNMFHMALASNSIEELKKWNSTEAYEFKSKYQFSTEGVVESIKEGVIKIWEFIKSVFAKIIEVIKSFFSWIASFFKGDEAEKCEEATKDREKVTKAAKNNAKKPAGKKKANSDGEDSGNQNAEPNVGKSLSIINDRNDKPNEDKGLLKIGNSSVEDVSNQVISLKGVDKKTWSKSPKKTVAFIKAYCQSASPEVLDAMTKYEKEIKELAKKGINEDSFFEFTSKKFSGTFSQITEVHKREWTVDKVLYGVDKAQKIKYTYLEINELIPNDILYKNVYEALKILAAREQKLEKASKALLMWMEKLDPIVEEQAQNERLARRFRDFFSLAKKSKEVITLNAKFAIGLSKEIDTVRKNTLKVYTALKKAVEAYL